MSPRVLEFGTHQVRWRCRCKSFKPELIDGWTPSKIGSSAPEIDWTILPEHHRSLTATEAVSLSPGVDYAWRIKRGLSHLLRRSAGHPIRLGITGPSFITTWEDIVQHYTQRGLTQPEDKLPAISAIARELERLSGYEYVAGLWKHEIPRLLQWRVEGIGKRPPKYVAPSWSWASLTGKIRFEGFSTVGLKVINVKLETLPPNDTFGQVMGGTLQVRGMVSEVIVRPSKERYAYPNQPTTKTKSRELVGSQARHGSVPLSAIWPPSVIIMVMTSFN
jgi:hypothetical protein